MSSNKKIQLRYKFCKPQDVNLKRQSNLMFKVKFLVQLYHLKSRGTSQTLYVRLQRWLDLNLDDLYEKFVKNKIKKSMIQKMKKNHDCPSSTLSNEDLSLLDGRLRIGSCAHKQKFKEQLFAQAEQWILSHRQRYRRKQIDLINEMTNQTVPYEKRNYFIESNIENLMAFLNPKDCTDFYEDRQKLKKVLKNNIKQNEKFIKARESALTLANSP